VDLKLLPQTDAHFYSVFGLRVCANRPVEVFPRTAAGKPDLALHLEGTAPSPFDDLPRSEWYECPDKDDSGEPFLRIWKLNQGDYFHCRGSDGVEFFFDRAGERMWSFWPEHLDFDEVLTSLAGPIFGCLLFIRGVTCLHGSAVAVGSKAITLLGPPGAGKSTTAAAFALSRFPVLSDDIVAVREQHGDFLVQPAFRRLCLWPSSVEALYGSAEALPRLTKNWEKQGLALGGNGCRFQEQALPLAAVYVLGERTSQNPSGTIVPLAPRDALIHLVANTYASRLPNERREREFDELARLVSRVPVRQVTAHPSASNLQRLRSAIVEDFAGLAS
jgi:hypothetical protein